METQTRYETAVQAKRGVLELRELLRLQGHYADSVSMKTLQELADQLSDLAHVAEDKRWTCKYLNQVLHDKLAAGQALFVAIQQQAAISQGVRAEMATGLRVVVLAAQGVSVHADALVLADSRRCACGLWFVPRVPWQRFHSAGCRSKVRKG